MDVPLLPRKVRCATRKCDGFVSIDAATVTTSPDGHWQFQCPRCNYWNLVSSSSAVQATSPAPFDLERLPVNVRFSSQVKRSPPGGV
jgi:hypothetical protein